MPSAAKLRIELSDWKLSATEKEKQPLWPENRYASVLTLDGVSQ